MLEVMRAQEQLGGYGPGVCIIRSSEAPGLHASVSR